MQTHATPTSLFDDLRQRTGLPPDSPLILKVGVLLPALSGMLLLRHDLGVRIVGAPRLAALIGVLLIWGLPPSMLLADELRTADDLWRPMFFFTLGTAVVGACHRISRWANRFRGERLNSLSLGRSWLAAILPQDAAERYADPLVLIGGGVALCASPIDLSYAVLGSWLVLSGVMLYGIEKYIHELQLNHSDARLLAEAHQQVTAAGLADLSPSASVVEQEPLATGLDPRLAQRITERQQAGPANRSDDASRADLETPQGPIALERPGPEAATPDDLTSANAGYRNQPDTAVPSIAGDLPRHGPRPATPWGLVFAAVIFLLMFVGSLYVEIRDSRAASVQPPSEQPVRVMTAGNSVAGNANDTEALFNAGFEGLQQANGELAKETAAARLLLQAAERGHPIAQSIIGSLYLRGLAGLPEDHAKGVTWLSRAAKAKDRVALYRLAALYEAGVAGLQQDEAYALVLYRESAQQGFADAQAAVGHMYLTGRGGVSRDDREAVTWFVKAYRGGSKHGRGAVKVLADGARAGKQNLIALLEENGVDWRRELLRD